MHTLQNRLGKIELLIAAVIVSALAGCGTSQNQAPPTTATIAPAPEAAAAPSAKEIRAKSSAMRAQMSPEVSGKLNTAMVLAQIHQANLMEVELAKMAREKGSINGVRAYADQLIQDHTSLDQTVVAMAQKGGNLKAVRRSAHETADEKTVERKLKSANGAKFDKLFLQQASSDHERLIRRLQQDREDASDEDLEALIDKTIPILEQHKELAQILMNKEQASGQADQTHG
jgi:predicted outer membrane protein